MNSVQEKTSEYGREVSFVDLAATFVRRRHVFYWTFLLTVLAGVISALVASEKYQYVSLIESAEKASGEYIEEPAVIVSTLANRWVPDVISSFAQKDERKLPFRVQVANPDQTGLIRITSVATADSSALVDQAHQQLIENVVDRQQRLIESHEQSLQRQADSLDKVIDSLRSSGSGENTQTALATAIEKRVDLAARIESLKPAEVLVVGRKSTEKRGPARVVIIALSAILGVILGVSLAFFTEFVIVVREKLADTSI